MKTRFYRFGVTLFTLIFLFGLQTVNAQRGGINWAKDGYQYYQSARGGSAIFEYDTRDSAKKTVIVTKEMLTPQGKKSLTVSGFAFSQDGNKVMIFTNTKRVWRYNTRGDYWVYDLNAKTLKQLGVGTAQFDAKDSEVANGGLNPGLGFENGPLSCPP